MGLSPRDGEADAHARHEGDEDQGDTHVAGNSGHPVSKVTRLLCRHGAPGASRTAKAPKKRKRRKAETRETHETRTRTSRATE